MRVNLSIAALGLILLIACVLPTPPGPLPTHGIPTPVAEASKNVWLLMMVKKITQEMPDGSTVETHQFTHGTGFPVQRIGKDIVMLTAGHVADDMVNASARIPGGPTLLNGRLLERHANLDLALVAFETSEDIELQEIDQRVPRFGEIVYVAGYPGPAQRLFLGLGVVSDPDINTVAVYPGSSGSPVFDASGKVIALVDRVGFYGNQVIPHLCYTILMRDL